MKNKFKKTEITANVKTWQDYQKASLDNKHPGPILLPVFVGINEKAEIVKKRIKANLLGDPSDSSSLIAKAIESSPVFQHDRLKEIHKDYSKFFSQDFKQGGFPASPLDFHIKMPVVFMFVLSNQNWTFTGDKQFSTDNDSQANPTVKQICAFGGMRGILLENNGRAKERIKYNLHVTISQYVNVPQQQDAELMTTDIIIDPGMNNGDIGTGN